MMVDQSVVNATSSRTSARATSAYRYVMISSEVRRDLQAPLQQFEQLDMYHLYRSAPWNDMKSGEFDERTTRFRWPWDVFWTLRHIQPDIVQGPEPLSLLMLPFLCATLVYLWLHPQVKLVTLSLEPIPLEKKYHPLIVPLFRLILRWWFQRATVIFWFDSGSHRNLLANGAPLSKLVNMIYGSWGIDVNEFSPDGHTIAINTTDPVLLYVGRLSAVKGVTYLIDAFKLLIERGAAVHLAIVGDGPERTRLEAQALRLGLNNKITWFGNVKNADLPPYMRRAACLVLPSITTKLWVQQLSITAWQAMGCGLPVISTQTGCMEEFTPSDVGILVPERDAVQLADAITDLLADASKHRRMSQHARQYALDRFDATRNVQIAEQTILDWCG